MRGLDYERNIGWRKQKRPYSISTWESRWDVERSAILAKESHFNAAINRLYYACFYAASALLVANSISAASHAGVKTMLGMNFISKGILSKEHGKTFSRLFEIRHSGDYDDFVYCDQEMIYEYKPKGVCSTKMIFKIENNKVIDLEVINGCSGNLKGIISLIKGQNIDYIISKLKDIKCGMQQTSWPDQIAISLINYTKSKKYDIINKEV